MTRQQRGDEGENGVSRELCPLCGQRAKMREWSSGKDGGCGLGETAKLEDFIAIVVPFERKVLGMVLRENNRS